MKLILCFWCTLFTLNVVANDIYAIVENAELKLSLNKYNVINNKSCEKDARIVTLLIKKTNETFNGCWIVTKNGVQIAWLDGDNSLIPFELFKKPLDINLNQNAN